MRIIAETIAARDPAFVCLHGVDPGDALAVATRFARGYAYRGGQALLWTHAFAAREVQDRYLPVLPLRPFDRRGILQVDGVMAGLPLTLVATRFAAEREAAIRELRFARHVLRSIDGALIAFVAGMSARTERIGFDDLGMRVQYTSRDQWICARDVSVSASIVRV